MVLDIIRQFNWVDIAIIIFLIRICYISFKNELPVELFKLAGSIAAIYISLHYYTSLADLFRQRLGIKDMPLAFLDFICFVFLAVIGYLIFMLLRFIFWRLVRVEAVSLLNRWGSLVIGVFRGFLLAGLLTFALVISTISYCRDSVGYSYLGMRFFKVAPAAYTWLWEAVTSKFMRTEKFNDTVSEVKSSFYKK